MQRRISQGSPRTGLLLLLASALLLTAMELGLTGCVTRASTQATRTVAAEVASTGKVSLGEEASAKCEAAPLPKGEHPTQLDYALFGLAQTVQLAVCEERRASAARAVVIHNEAVDATVAAVKPRPWWQFWAR